VGLIFFNKTRLFLIYTALYETALSSLVLLLLCPTDPSHPFGAEGTIPSNTITTWLGLCVCEEFCPGFDSGYGRAPMGRIHVLGVHGCHVLWSYDPALGHMVEGGLGFLGESGGG
jgi:hypothetical protein